MYFSDKTVAWVSVVTLKRRIWHQNIYSSDSRIDLKMAMLLAYNIAYPWGFDALILDSSCYDQYLTQGQEDPSFAHVIH